MTGIYTKIIAKLLFPLHERLKKHNTVAIKNHLEEKYAPLINTVALSFDKQERNVKALESTLPLDPLVSLLLGPISRRRFSQNERSLFGSYVIH